MAPKKVEYRNVLNNLDCRIIDTIEKWCKDNDFEVPSDEGEMDAKWEAIFEAVAQLFGDPDWYHGN